MLPAKKKIKHFEEKSSKKMKRANEKKSNNESEEKPVIKKIKHEDFKKSFSGIVDVKKKFNKETNFKNVLKKRVFTKKSKVKVYKKGEKAGQVLTERELSLVKMKRQARKQERKKSESKVYEISAKAKSIWEVLRRDDCSKEKRERLLKDLMNVIRGHVKQLIFAHDTVRVIECIVAVGTEKDRNALFEELEDCLTNLATSKYAKFFLIKILNYGTKKQKDLIIKALEGKIVTFIRHTQAAVVVETAYNEYANAKQRSFMIQEFYGPSFTYFKDETCTSLRQLLSKDPAKKEEILPFMKSKLLSVLGKNVLHHSIVHHVLREYMEQSDRADHAEIVQEIRNGLVEILHTKDGSRVSMMCLWSGSAKDRKIIVKSMKTHIVKIAKEEQGHLVLLAAFDTLDDTKLIERIIIQELLQNSLELANNQFGRKVLLYLLSPRNGCYFHPDVINILEQGDGNQHSKKTATARNAELLLCVSEGLLQFAAESAKQLLQSNATCFLLLSILKHSSGDTLRALMSLAELVKEPYLPAERDVHMVEQTGLSFVFNKILKETSNKREDIVQMFVDVLLEIVPKGVFRTWIECNRGAFLLLNLLETNISSIVSRLKKELQPVLKSLESKTYIGAELLLKKLNECL